MGKLVEPWHRIHETFHPTDCSPGTDVALQHALRIAAAAGARLTLMRVGPSTTSSTDEFPNVRGILNRWRSHAKPDDPIADIDVEWCAASGNDPGKSCLAALERRPTDLIVVATHQLDGKMTWLEQHVAEPLFRSSREMTLLIAKGNAGFVNPDSGAITLQSILVPIANEPRPEPAIEAARRIMLFLPEAQGTATLLHVGGAAKMPDVQLPEMPGWHWHRIVQTGNVVETILNTAVQVNAGLITMTTRGRHGFLDALRGSTTEVILRRSNCPLLTLPVGSFLG